MLRQAWQLRLGTEVLVQKANPGTAVETVIGCAYLSENARVTLSNKASAGVWRVSKTPYVRELSQSAPSLLPDLEGKQLQS